MKDHFPLGSLLENKNVHLRVWIGGKIEWCWVGDKYRRETLKEIGLNIKDMDK